MKKVISAVSCAVFLQLALCFYVGVCMPLAAKKLIGDTMEYRFQGDDVYRLCALGCAVAAGLYILLRFLLKRRGWWHFSGTLVFHGLSVAVLTTAAVFGFLAFRCGLTDSPIFLYAGEGKGTLYSGFFMVMFFTYGVHAFIDALCAIRKIPSSRRLKAKNVSAVLYQVLIIFWILFCLYLLEFADFRLLGKGLLTLLNFMLLDGLLMIFGVVLFLILLYIDRRRINQSMAADDTSREDTPSADMPPASDGETTTKND